MHKVLHIRSSSEMLGAERVVLELCQNSPDFGIDPIIGVPIDKSGRGIALCEAARALRISVREFPIAGPFDLGVLKKIRAYVEDNDIQIVHSHGYREDLYATACRDSAKLIATNHLWKRTTWRLKAYAALDAYLLRRFPRVVAVSDAIATELQAANIDKDKITVISNGVDLNALSQRRNGSIRSEFGLDDQDIVLGTVSSLTSEKAVKNAIFALARCSATLPSLRLLIVGNGPEAENLRRQATDRGVASSTIFAGRRQDIPDVLACMDLFLLPSLIEGLPMALLEAMASGLPVIATAVGDVPKVVDSDVGVLIEPGNIDQLAVAVKKLCADSKERYRLGQNAKQRIAEDYSSRAMTAKYAALYDQLLSN